MYEIILSVRFQRQLRKLVKSNPRLKPKIKKVLTSLSKEINKPSLRLHKLSGQANWSVSVTRDIRIIFHIERNKIYCLTIGSHDDVY